MKFNENLVRYRKLKGFTQEEMAEKMKVSRQSVSKWENGEAVPELAKIIKLADILEISLDVLCGREEKEPNILVTECESKNTKRKNNKLFVIVILMLIGVNGIFGYYIWNSMKDEQYKVSNVYDMPDTIEVEDVIFKMEKNVLTCKFVPSIYSEKLSYRVILSDNWGDKFYNTKFENGIGEASMIVGDYNTCNLFLEVSNGEESRGISLGKIIVNDNMIRYPE